MLQRSVFRQVLATMSAYLLNFHMGLGYAWAASNMEYLQSSEGNGFTYEECTMVASLLHIGRLSSPFACFTVMRRFGRKPPIVLASLLMLISTVMTTVYKAVIPVYIARFMFGFGVGMYDCFGTIYIGEISLKSIRGIFMTLNIAFYSGGILIQYILGYYLTYKETSTLTIALSIILLLSTYYMVESPYHLVEQNQIEEASKVLSWLRASEEKEIQNELHDIINMERAANFKEFISKFKNPEVYKSYIIVFVLGIIASALMTTTVTFANYIVPSSGIISSYHFAMLLCCIPLFASFLSTFVVDRYGRRPLLIGSFLFETIVNGIITVLYVLQEKFAVEIPHFSWLVFALVFVYLITYSLVTYPPILTLRSELFPASYKILGCNICISLNATTNFVCTIFFMQVTQIYGMYLNYVLFTISCFVGVLTVYFLLPETKGKTLHEIQLILKGNKD